MDGWISSEKTGNKRRRREGSSSPDLVELIETRRSEETPPEEVSSSVLPGESAASSPDSSTRLMMTCQYGSKCYRRNATHLREYSHPFLECVYKEMKGCGDFTAIPVKMLREAARLGVESKVVLGQIEVLRSVGFVGNDGESPPEKVRKMEKPDQATAGSSKGASSGGSERQSLATEGERWKNSLEDTKHLRRKKYLESLAKQEDKGEDVKTRGGRLSMLDKWKASCPFNFFLTEVTDISDEKPNVFSCSFKDLFDPSLGEVKALFHANFLIEMEWFMDQVMDAGVAGKNTWLIFDGDSKDLQGAAEAFPWLKINGVKSPFPFGHHHTKMSIVQYTDESVRFFIYTANLVESDWDNRTQGIWISPRCPKLQGVPSSATSGDSSTKFKSDIIQYLQTYPVKASAAWIHLIKAVDCSEIKVHFVGSAPVTSASGTSGFQWAQAKLDKVLKSLDNEVDPTWPLVIQCSSIGSLGKSIEDWVQSELAKSMSGKDRIVKGPIRIIYPSHSNVQRSFDGLAGGGCLPYGFSTHAKQPWLEKFLCQWKADCVGRSRAVPHIKGYCRVSPDDSKLAWFLLTSANLSKAAWGKFTKRGDRLSVMSWEAGVLFHPLSLTSRPYFNLRENSDSSCGTPRFPMPFDIPVTKYETNDKPWFMDTLQALIMQQQLRK